MKVEVAVLGSPSIISLVVSVDVKQHGKALIRAPERPEEGKGLIVNWICLSLQVSTAALLDSVFVTVQHSC